MTSLIFITAFTLGFVITLELTWPVKRPRQ